MRLVIQSAIVLLLVGMPFHRVTAQTVVGGEMFYHDVEDKADAPAPGVEIYLISGEWTEKILPADGRREDQDTTADARRGAEPRDAGTFVLYTANNFRTTTVMFYPWPRQNQDPMKTPLLLSRVVRTRPKDTNSASLRARLRLDCTPTDLTYTDGRQVADAIRQANLARTIARRALDYGDLADANYLKELALIASMIDPMRWNEIEPRARRLLSGDEQLLQGLDTVKFKFQSENDRSDIRKDQLERWKRLRQAEPRMRTFGGEQTTS